VSYIVISKLNLHPQAISVLNRVFFIEDPVFDLTHIGCHFGSFQLFLSLQFFSLRVLPDHDLEGRTMAESNEVIDRPVNAQNRLLVLLLPQGLAGLTLPNNEQARFVSTCYVCSLGAHCQASDGMRVPNKGDVEGCGKRSQCRGVWQFGNQ
jgi:hypothetical protein